MYHTASDRCDCFLRWLSATITMHRPADKFGYRREILHVREILIRFQVLTVYSECYRYMSPSPHPNLVLDPLYRLPIPNLPMSA